MYENNLLTKDSIIYDATDGSIKKHICANVTGYRILCETRVINDYTRLSLLINSISLKCIYQVLYMKEH